MKKKRKKETYEIKVFIGGMTQMAFRSIIRKSKIKSKFSKKKYRNIDQEMYIKALVDVDRIEIDADFDFIWVGFN